MTLKDAAGACLIGTPKSRSLAGSRRCSHAMDGTGTDACLGAVRCLIWHLYTAFEGILGVAERVVDDSPEKVAL